MKEKVELPSFASTRWRTMIINYDDDDNYCYYDDDDNYCLIINVCLDKVDDEIYDDDDNYGDYDNDNDEDEYDDDALSMPAWLLVILRKRRGKTL